MIRAICLVLLMLWAGFSIYVQATIARDCERHGGVAVRGAEKAVVCIGRKS